MNNWAQAIPLATLLVVVFAAGGVYTTVRIIAKRLDEALAVLEKLGLRLTTVERDHSVLEARTEDLISQVKRREQQHSSR